MSLDILILTIYLLIVLYVLYQMALSLEAQLEDQVSIALDQERLKTQIQAQLTNQPRASHVEAEVKTLPEANDQKAPRTPSLSLKFRSPNDDDRTKAKRRGTDLSGLEEQGIDLSGLDDLFAERIAVRVLPTGKRPLEPAIAFLTVLVSNTTADLQLYIDWDRSSITVLSNQAQRAIRLIPGMDFDLFQSQIFSVVNPQQTLRANVTTEQSFIRNAETQRIEPGKPLVNLQQTVGFLQVTTRAGLKPRDLYSLGLLIGIKRVTEPDSQIVTMLAPFHFTLELLPEEVALPPLRWLLNLSRRREQRLIERGVARR